MELSAHHMVDHLRDLELAAVHPEYHSPASQYGSIFYTINSAGELVQALPAPSTVSTPSAFSLAQLPTDSQRQISAEVPASAAGTTSQRSVSKPGTEPPISSTSSRRAAEASKPLSSAAGTNMQRPQAEQLARANLHVITKAEPAEMLTELSPTANYSTTALDVLSFKSPLSSWFQYILH